MTPIRPSERQIGVARAALDRLLKSALVPVGDHYRVLPERDAEAIGTVLDLLDAKTETTEETR